MTTVLDVSALIIAGLQDGPVRTARLTYAMARHAVVDLTRVQGLSPQLPDPDRLPAADLGNLRKALAAAGHILPEGQSVDEKLSRLRLTYEPYLNALGKFLLMSLPEWLPTAHAQDNWQRMA